MDGGRLPSHELLCAHARVGTAANEITAACCSAYIVTCRICEKNMFDLFRWITNSWTEGGAAPCLSSTYNSAVMQSYR